MDLITLLFFSVGLCFDSFAVSLSCGMQCRGAWRGWPGVRFALILGLLQGLMPLIGWLLASRFSGLIHDWDHWVAFLLLAFLGGKMIYEALTSKEEEERAALPCEVFALRRSFTLGLATSIDALASGVAIAFLPLTVVPSGSVGMNMAAIVLVIAVVTILASLMGLFLGTKSGTKLGAKAEVLGGLILIAIGVKVVLEHTCF